MFKDFKYIVALYYQRQSSSDELNLIRNKICPASSKAVVIAEQLMIDEKCDLYTLALIASWTQKMIKNVFLIKMEEDYMLALTLIIIIFFFQINNNYIYWGKR